VFKSVYYKIKQWFRPEAQKPHTSAFEILKYIGPGLIVTIGFIDPGNWASNLAAGSGFGYSLLWMVTLSTIMLIILQHNAAHLGIATGLCLSEAATTYLPKAISRTVLGSAVLASISTAMAEILGGAIALNMLFGIPVILGALMVLGVVLWMIYSNSYRKTEKYIIAIVSLIGLCFIFELALVDVDWSEAAYSWVVPRVPHGSVFIIMCVLGAVVMPHNLYLHSEIIQSRKWNIEDKKIIRHQMKFEFADTLFSMIVGWAINSAMILVAASVFFSNHIEVNELGQAHKMLEPLLGKAAAIVFAIALLFAGISSSVTAGMAGGSIFAGFFNEPYNIKDKHSKMGVGIALIGAVLSILLVGDPFKGLIISQILLSMQLPFTIFLQIYLTGSKKVMGVHANKTLDSILLWIIGIVVSGLNILLLIQVFFGFI
jgi:manganese transport protein